MGKRSVIATFLGHLLAGVFLFVAVGSVALLLGWLVDKLPPWAPSWIKIGLEGTEFLFFASDIVLLLRMSFRAFTDLWDSI